MNKNDLLIKKEYDTVYKIDKQQIIENLKFIIDYYQTVEFKFNYGGIPLPFEQFLFEHFNINDNMPYSVEHKRAIQVKNNIANFLFKNKKTYSNLPFIQFINKQNVVGIIDGDNDVFI